MQETQVWSLGEEDPMEKGMAIPSSALGWRIPWTEEPGGLQSMGCQRVRQDWATFTHHPQKELTPELPSIWVQGPGRWAGRSSREPHRAESLRAVMEGRGEGPATCQELCHVITSQWIRQASKSVARMTPELRQIQEPPKPWPRLKCFQRCEQTLLQLQRYLGLGKVSILELSTQPGLGPVLGSSWGAKWYKIL